MSNMIPFTEGSKLPAHLKQLSSEKSLFAGGSAGGYPVISVKGKVFTINRNGEKTLVTKPGDDESPAPSLEVVILDGGPKGISLYAKTFYAEGYSDGSNAKPTCYSNDGISPAADAQEAQSAKCQICPQNAKGSGANQQNPDAKACRSSKMLAVAPAGQLNDPMLLRVPGSSLLPLRDYVTYLEKRGVQSMAQVVTKVGFDFAKPYPMLKFTPVGFPTPEMTAEISKQKDSKLVKAIIGEIPLSELANDDLVSEAEAPAPAIAAKPAAKPVVESDDDLPTSPPKKAIKVEDAEPPKPKKPAAKPVSVEDEAGIDAALDSLIDYDD